MASIDDSCKMGSAMFSDIPTWIPCTTCHYERQFHVDKKCPFDSTEFRPSDDVVDLILGEMEYLNEQYEGKGYSLPLGAIPLAVRKRRYLKAFEIVVDTMVGKLNL